MGTRKLKAPQNLSINITPSPRQYELWKLLQPDYCPNCGGHITQKQIGVTNTGKPLYEPVCDTCGTNDIPQLILGGGAAGGGKGEPLDAQIVTPFGMRRFGDLKVGDIVTSALTGGVTEVIALHPIEERDYYRVHFIDGTYVDCSDNHIWRGHFSRKKSKKAKKYADYYAIYGDDELILAHQLYKWYQDKANGMYDGVHFIIPLCKPVRFTISTKQYVHPYVAGAMIGNGSMTTGCIEHNSVTLTTIDKDVIDRCIELGAAFSQDKYTESGQANTYVSHNVDFINNLIKSELAGHSAIDKFIPRRYKLGTIEERIALMQGLMDTDGYVDERGHMSYCTISQQLAEDVAFVVRSLGGVASINKKSKTGYKDADGNFVQTNDAYNVWIRIENAPDLVYASRKKERTVYGFNGGASELGKRVTNVEYIGKKMGRCITVKEPSGLYLTDNFTVTHNSFLGSNWIVSSCMRFSDIRAVVARKTIKSLKESTFNTIKKVLKSWGLVEDEHYHINNLENTLTFWNNSVIILKEMVDLPSDPQFERFGSSEYTIAFVDEVSEISEKAVEVLFSRLRWRTDETFKTAKMLMTTNPCLTWVRSRFVQDDDGNTVECRQNERYVPFSVWDNPDSSFVATYVSAMNKISDPLTRARLLYGEWNYVESNKMAAYWSFDGKVHLVNNLYESKYDPLAPLILGWDFNVAPYMSALEVQINYTDKEIYILREITGKPADKLNNTPALARVVARSLVDRQHLGHVLITGDPAGNARSTQTEDGVTNFTILRNTLREANPVLEPEIKLFSKQPPHVTRLEYINKLFEGYDGWKIMIDMRCRKLTEDLVYQRKNDDGTKEKKKVTNPVTKTKEEKYGHLSDCLDYTLCYFTKKSWELYQKGEGNDTITIATAQAQYTSYDY